MNKKTLKQELETLNKIACSGDVDEQIKLAKEMQNTELIFPQYHKEKQENIRVIQKWASKLTDCKTNEEVLEKAWKLEKGEINE